MSLILDALKKAENERKDTPDTPSIVVDHGDTTSHVNNSHRRQLILLACAGLVTLIVLIIVLLSRGDPTDSSQIANTTNEQRSNVNDEAARKPMPGSIETLNKASQQSSRNLKQVDNTISSGMNPKSVDPAIDKIDSSQKERNTLNSNFSNTNVATPETKEAIDKLYDDQTNDLKPEPDIQTTNNQQPPAPNSVSSSQSMADTDSLSHYESIKHIKELPFSTQERIPTLIYSQHMFSDIRNRHIVINGKQIRENTQIASGIRLDKILKDGALMTLDGTKFKMRALNSWLNY